MFLYREHRELLKDAMETVQSFHRADQLVEFVESIYGPGEVKVEAYVWDDRIKWDTHIVTHNGNGVGFTDGPVEELASESPNV